MIRNVLITGGSRGIGLAIAHRFAQDSYQCTLLSRSPDALQAAVCTLPTPDPKIRHRYIAGDVSDADFWTHDGIGRELGVKRRTEVPKLGTETETPREKDVMETPRAKNSTERIDVLVNCAGVAGYNSFVRTDRHMLQDVLNTNLTGLMLGTQYLLRHRVLKAPAFRGEKDEEKRTAVIINVASLLALRGGFGAVSYSASKAGVLGFTRALALELGRSGVRVNAIVPGYIETDMIADLNLPTTTQKIPLQRLGKPEEVADAAMFLAKNQYAHNCVINIDGGLSAT